jgi:hypothetical protein
MGSRNIRTKTDISKNEKEGRDAMKRDLFSFLLCILRLRFDYPFPSSLFSGKGNRNRQLRKQEKKEMY